MNCKIFEKQIWNYLEGQNDASVGRLMESHARQCEQCRHALTAAKSTLSGIPMLPRFSMPNDFTSKLQARLEERRVHNTQLQRGWARWREALFGGNRSLGFSLVPAVSLLVIAIGWFAWSDRDPLPKDFVGTISSQEQSLSEEYAQACLQIHEQMTVSELAGDPTTDYLLMTTLHN